MYSNGYMIIYYTITLYEILYKYYNFNYKNNIGYNHHI